MYVYDRLDNRQVRVVCGNDIAASVAHLIRENLNGIFVMIHPEQMTAVIEVEE